MIESYWDLYVAYIDKCVRDNWANDIDPAHYEMEWNHFLPQCIFGDQPIGHWLTKHQHAIASALQTLVFRQNCMCGWHKKDLPELLLLLAWPYFCMARSETMKSLNEIKDDLGKSEFATKAGQTCLEQKVGIHGRSAEQMKIDGRKGDQVCRDLGIGIYSQGHRIIVAESNRRRTGVKKPNMSRCVWWVNEQGETCRFPDKPEGNWQRGRKWKSSI